MILLGLLLGLIPIFNLIFIITGFAYPIKSITDNVALFHIGAGIGMIICYTFITKGML